MIKKILLLLAILPSFVLAQHTIKGKITPTQKLKFAFLYKVTPKTAIFVSNGTINEEDGSFEIKIDSLATPGTYRIVYAQPQEDYNFDLIYDAKEDIELEYDLKSGIQFKSSKENILYQSYNKSIALVNQSIREYFFQKNTSKEDFNAIFETLTKTQSEFEKASKGMIAEHFIKACKPYIPSEYEDITTFSKQIKKHYFDHIDFSNPVLQHSNFLIKNTLGYVFNFIDERDLIQSYKNNVDDVVKAIGENTEIKRILLEILWNQFADKGNEPIANYIAENYLLELAKADNDQELITNITYFKNASIGSKAYDFKMEVKGEKDKIDLKYLSELDSSENYLIFFWSTTCSHCLDEIPHLKDYVKSINKEDLQVIAVALDNDYYRWSDMRYEYPDFIHVFGEGKWDNIIGDNFNVRATPSYFVLDKNKIIIGKPDDFEAFKSYFETLSEGKKNSDKETKDIMIEKKVEREAQDKK